jgi:hypothetical protein
LKEADERKKERKKEMNAYAYAYAIVIAERRINERIQSQGHPTSL